MLVAPHRPGMPKGSPFADRAAQANGRIRRAAGAYLRSWLDATAQADVNGTAIQTPSVRAGSGLNLKQATAADRPAIRHGLSRVPHAYQFDGVSDHFESLPTTLDLTGVPSISVATVFRSDAAAGQDTIAETGTGATPGRFSFFVFNTVPYAYGQGSTGQSQWTGNTALNGVWKCLAFRFDTTRPSGLEAMIYDKAGQVAGSASLSAENAGNLGNLTLGIGARTDAANPLQGYIAEHIITAGAPLSVLLAVRAALDLKWGL